MEAIASRFEAIASSNKKLLVTSWIEVGSLDLFHASRAPDTASMDTCRTPGAHGKYQKNILGDIQKSKGRPMENVF